MFHLRSPLQTSRQLSKDNKTQNIKENKTKNIKENKSIKIKENKGIKVKESKSLDNFKLPEVKQRESFRLYSNQWD